VENVIVSVQITKNPPGIRLDFKVGHVNVSYLDVETASIKNLHVDCVIRRSRDAAHDPATSNRSVSVQRARIDMVRALEESRANADAGQYAQSRQCLAACDHRLVTLMESARAANDGGTGKRGTRGLWCRIELSSLLCQTAHLSLAIQHRLPQSQRGVL